MHSNKVKTRKSTGAILLEFLGSMNLAITVLVAIAIASVIGTVLQQNEAYDDLHYQVWSVLARCL